MDIRDGRLWIDATVNANAAISTAANLAGQQYTLSGAGITVGIWDGGDVLTTHRELAGRVTLYDSSGVNWHSTHVAGTVAAAGITPGARGMASAATLDSYDFLNDLAEMAGRGATASNAVTDIFISNHSYGVVAGWVSGVAYSGTSGWHWMGVNGDPEDRAFGQYDSDTGKLDDLCYAAPFYLPFKSAGNDRNDGPPLQGSTYFYFVQTSPVGGAWLSKSYDPVTDPQGDGVVHGGYDTLPTEATAKNIITVGSVSDAVSGGTRDLSQASVSSFTGWGPTDDGRIKPDIVANGELLYSCDTRSDSSYTSASGTSMSSPNACGSAALLQELHQDTFGYAARASRLKALILHMADDIETPGPDYRTGWGLMNTEAAADLIARSGQGADGVLLADVTLATGAAEAWDVTVTTSTVATLCWTDPAGSSTTSLNDPTLKLVNDLDLRIAKRFAAPSLPFVLDPAAPAAPATTGDNVRDNVEQIRLGTASGTYRITVSHKGTLSGGSQVASLVVSGMTSWRRVAATVAEAVDQPAVAFSDSGELPWGYQSAITLDGQDAARSGAIGRNAASSFETTVTGPADISFAWRVSSLPNDDYAYFRVNGESIDSISGETSWARVSHVLPAGQHTLRWSYEKDQNKTAGDDAAWVDDLQIVYPIRPTIIYIR